jgi:hypothetical protein
MAKSEEHLGGGLTPVVRMGSTVRRPTGPWTPAVHALLRHLHTAGFDGAPRVLGLDEDGREVLEFVEGRADADPFDDRSLARVARLVRAFHDAAATFEPPEWSNWQYLTGAPRSGEIVCHNDLSPANTIYAHRGPVAFVDWDLAAPGTRVWDVAYALWRFVPLYDDEDCGRLGIPAQPRGPRIRLFCDSYGLDDRDRRELLDVVRLRQQALYDTARVRGEAGERGWAEVWRDTRGRQWLRSIRYLDSNRTKWERSLG